MHSYLDILSTECGKLLLGYAQGLNFLCYDLEFYIVVYQFLSS
jgi:hypothetical protein